MAAYLLSLRTISPLFLVIFIGILLSRHRSVNREWVMVLNNFALWVGFPALILVALSRIHWDFNLYGKLVVWNMGFVIFSTLLAYPIAFLFKTSNSIRRTLFLALSFGNVTYLGVPVLRHAFGEGTLPESMMISAVYLFCLFTFALVLVEIHSETAVKPLKLLYSLISNPLLIAVFVGILLSVTQIKLPEVIGSAFDLLADSVTAVVLLSLGLFLGMHSFGKLSDWIPVLTFSVIILVFMPFIFYWVSGVFFEHKDIRNWIIEAAMPMGLTPYVLATKYELNVEFASRTVVLSTLLSIFTLPFWLILLG